MSTSREAMLGRVRASLGGIATKRPLPDYSESAAVSRRIAGDPSDRRGRFCARLKAAGGRSLDDPGALRTFLGERRAFRGYADPELIPWLTSSLGPEIVLEGAVDRARLDDYQFGITRAAGAIAETGTLILTEASTPERLGALAPWIHVAVLDPASIHEHLGDALAVLGEDQNVIFCTGPSKTADVEGILIQGVHGPGEEVALLAVPPREIG